MPLFYPQTARLKTYPPLRVTGSSSHTGTQMKNGTESFIMFTISGVGQV